MAKTSVNKNYVLSLFGSTIFGVVCFLLVRQWSLENLNWDQEPVQFYFIEGFMNGIILWIPIILLYLAINKFNNSISQGITESLKLIIPVELVLYCFTIIYQSFISFTDLENLFSNTLGITFVFGIELIIRAAIGLIIALIFLVIQSFIFKNSK